MAGLGTFIHNRSIDPQAILPEIKRRVTDGFHPQRIVLFGSRARGNYREDSDYDLLVIMPLARPRKTLMAEIDQCLWGLRIARDILVMSPEEFEQEKMICGTIAREAAKEGIIIYDAA